MLVDFEVESNKCLNSTAIILLSGFVYIYWLGLAVTLTDMEFAVLAVPVTNWRRCGNNQRDLYFWNIIKKCTNKPSQSSSRRSSSYKDSSAATK